MGKSLESYENLNPNFPNTHWSYIENILENNSEESKELLCYSYWKPIFTYIYYKVHDVDKAEDLTQSFFIRFLSSKFLKNINKDKGRLRYYLMKSIQHFIINQVRENQAQKRGGGRKIISIDKLNDEDKELMELSHELTPEKAFEMSWASSLIQKSFQRIEQDFIKKGKHNLFKEFSEYIFVRPKKGTYTELSAKVQMSESNVNKSIQRLRQKYFKYLRDEISKTVVDQNDVEAELNEILKL